MTTSLLVHQMMAGFLFGTSESLPMEVRSLERKDSSFRKNSCKARRRKVMFIWDNRDSESWKGESEA